MPPIKKPQPEVVANPCGTHPAFQSSFFNSCLPLPFLSPPSSLPSSPHPSSLIPFSLPSSLIVHRSSFLCAKGGTRTPTPFGYQILSLARLPIPPLSLEHNSNPQPMIPSTIPPIYGGNRKGGNKKSTSPETLYFCLPSILFEASPRSAFPRVSLSVCEHVLSLRSK